MSTTFEPVPRPEDYQGTPPDTDAIEGVIDSLPEVIRESKAGYKTTEFWMTIATVLCSLLAGLPEKYGAIVTLGAVGSYTLSRGIAKKGIPHIEVPAV